MRPSTFFLRLHKQTTDKSYVEFSLEHTWSQLVRRIAVLAAAGSAMTSLWFDVPVSIAALRGGCAYFGCLLIGRVAALAMSETARRASTDPSSLSESAIVPPFVPEEAPGGDQ